MENHFLEEKDTRPI